MQMYFMDAVDDSQKGFMLVGVFWRIIRMRKKIQYGRREDTDDDDNEKKNEYLKKSEYNQDNEESVENMDGGSEQRLRDNVDLVCERSNEQTWDSRRTKTSS